MSFDWDLYRQINGPLENPVWGRFPHPPISAIAARLRVSPNSIWRKWREWKRTGFVRGYLVLPHPQLLGVGLEVHLARIAGPEEKPAFLNDLELVDGVIMALHDVGSKVWILMVADSDKARDRRLEAIRRLPGAPLVGPARPTWLARCDGSLSREDVAVVVAVREAPESTLAQLSKATRLAPKTIARHLRRMKNSNLLLSHLLEDWGSYPATVASFRLVLEAGANWAAVDHRFQEEVPDSIMVPAQDRPPTAQRGNMLYYVPLRSGPQIDDIIRSALRISGVGRVETGFPVSERPYGAWLDDRVRLLAQSSAPHAR